MTFNSDDTLAKLVAAKLNHDYVSPLTAISNGLEIYQMDEDSREEAIALIGASLQSALNELQFNRIAFGSYGDDEQLALSDVTNRIKKFMGAKDFTLEPIEIQEPPFKYDAKLWYLCILCMRSSFVQLKHLVIAKTEQGWQLTGSGKGMVNSFGETRAENDWLQIGKLTPNTVQFPLLFILTDKLKYEVIFKRNEEEQLIVNFWRMRE